MARAVALAGVVVMLLSSTAHADDDMGGDGLTGVTDSETGEHKVPEVEAVSSPAPQPIEEPDLTVVVPAQVFTIWDRLAMCESSGNWHINSGNGYSGGLQFDVGTWLAYGGGAYTPRAYQASRVQQIAVAQRLHAARGFQPWPYCSKRLGLR